MSRWEAQRVERERDVEELTALLLDELVPVVGWYRVEVARRLGLGEGELACLEVLRRHGSAPVALLARRAGVTTSAASKLVRRLEEAGHVARARDPGDGRSVQVELVAHEDRERVLAELRRRLADHLATAWEGPDPTGRAGRTVGDASSALFGEAGALADMVGDRRYRDEARRRPGWPREVARVAALDARRAAEQRRWFDDQMY